ncbi:histidine--tRNA ligase [Chlamydiota bacterium]
MIKAVRGTKDILPNEILEWIFLEGKARELFGFFGYQEIRTPLFEQTDLFIKSIGDETDIVEKEMYTFLDQGKRSLTLRPEATAPVLRAVLEHHLVQVGTVNKLFYSGQMFRQERPQSGRLRQFNQIGIEYIGSVHPSADAETIMVLYTYLKEVGLEDVTILINSVGCTDCKKNHSVFLRDFFEQKITSFCETCQRRFSRNVFRLLDCKQKECHQLVEEAPALVDRLCKDCSEDFTLVQSLLTKAEIPFTLQPRLVRGLDYYTKTVFEVTHHNLGAKDALAAGGRYDGLISSMGGPEMGAVGFGIGVERLLLARKQKTPITYSPPDVFLISLGEKAYNENFLLSYTLQKNGISTEIDLPGKSIKAQLRKANKGNASYCIIRGDEELQKKRVILKDMKTGTEESIATTTVIEQLKKRL